jgi:autotransporter-associated beta strand protein
VDELGAPAAFVPGDNVIFDDTGSNTPAISLPASVAAGKLFFVAAQDYTLTGGGITGAAALSKVGQGKLTLLNANAFSGGTILNEGEIQLGDGVSVNGSLSGSITNNDTLTYANPNTLATSASITGSGTLTKIGAGALTITGTQTFTNLATVNAGSLQFSTTIPPANITNNTLVTFAVSGATIYSNVVSGPGVVNVSTASGNTYLTGSNIFTGGLTNVAGNLILSNNTAAGSGPVNYVAGFVMVGGGCTVSNDFTLVTNSATDLMLQGTNGTGTWAGNVVPANSAAQFRPGADTGGAFTFTGNAPLGARFLIVPRGSVTFGGNCTITTTQTGCALGRDGSANKRSANITLRDNAAITMGGCGFGGGKAGASVTVTVQNNAQLNIGAAILDLQNVANTAAISTLRLNGGVTTVGGFSKTLGYTNFINFNGGVLKAGQPNATFLTYGGTTTSSNLVQAGGAKIDDGGFAITISAPLVHDGALGATADGGLTKLGSGTLTLSGAETFTGNVTVSNGALVLTAAATLSTSSNLNLAAGIFDASALGGFPLTTGKIISGGGAVNGNFTMNSGATLAPGNPVGTLTFSNNLTLAAGSVQNFELGTTSDRVNVSGALTLGGTVNVTNVAGFGAGTYTLFTAASLSGALTLGSAPIGYNYALTNTPTAVQLVVVSTNTVPPVFSGAGTFSGNNLVFAGSNGTPLGNYFVLTSTNVTLPASNWTRLLTNQFDASGNFNFTGAVSTNVLDNFYRLQLP